jgi:hypothetical protein
VITGLVSGEASLPGLQITIFFLYPHAGRDKERERERQRERERERETLCLFFFLLGHQSYWIRPLPVTSFNLNYPFKGPVSKYGDTGG